MKLILSFLLVLIVGVVSMASDFVWVLFVVLWCGVWVWRLVPRWTCLIPMICGLAILIPHFCGHKLYGSPGLADNRPLLEHSLELARLEPPNVLIATDGSRHTIAGLELRPWIAGLSPEEQRAVVDRSRQPLRFFPDTGYPSGYVAEHRLEYFCGNSFFPSLLPHRLPTHTKRDLAVALRWLSVEPTKD